jgi:HD-GYP domain-containing protein (c-di-GMP phosphodiesterase class II)
MRDEEKTKDQLVKELQKMHEKIAGLEEVKLKYNQVNKRLKQSYKKLQKIIEGTAHIIMKVVEIRDPYSTGHQQRVSKLAMAIAQEMKLSQDKIEGTRIASLVHDIGKVNLPTEIVSKPSKLVEVEFNLIKNHPIDGSGYPKGLKGDEICIEAKILGVANVIEAMSSYKSYRPALSIDEALAEIIKNKNILFDSEVVDTCIKLFKEKKFKFES